MLKNESCDHEWNELDEHFTLKKYEGGTFKYTGYHSSYFSSFTRELPVIVHLCKKCGEIRLYSVKVKQEGGVL